MSLEMYTSFYGSGQVLRPLFRDFWISCLTAVRETATKQVDEPKTLDSVDVHRPASRR